MARLILLDRDGVINFDSPDRIRSPRQWCPLPGSLEAIAALQRSGRLVAVCTNQAGIARGLLSIDDLQAIHARLARSLARLGASLERIAFCPHAPEAGCACRKPAPGLLIECMQALSATPEETCLVGDSLTDLQAARAAGCEGILVRTGNGAALEARGGLEGARVYDDLAAFASRELDGT